jgi:threonine dehydrogenase-like Zn-dependent dehydrogenase
VIANDRVPERLEMARREGKAETIDIRDEQVMDRPNQLTANRGPDFCIDAVGLEAHGTGTVDAVVGWAKQQVMLGTDRPPVLREVSRPAARAGASRFPASTRASPTSFRSAPRSARA